MSRLIWLALISLALAEFAGAADVTGRWSPGPGRNVFVLQQKGEALTGVIQGEPGAPTYKIVDGKVQGDQVTFFVLHEAASDPEVKDNGGNPFHNFAKGTVSGDELTIEGSRENTDIRKFKIVLKRVKE
jgi:hypothetical protein